VSKLLDMLRKSKGEIADAVAPLFEGEVPLTLDAPPRPKGEGSSSSADEGAATRTGSAPVDAPSLAQIRTMSLRVPAPSPLLPFDNSQAGPSEQYRMLRTRIGHHPAQPSVIVITSPAPGDGKSVTAINTAAALALTSEGPVLLLDADLRKSVIHSQLGIPESPGLADVLSGTTTAEDAIVHTRDFPNLYVMSAGAPRANPAELLDSKVSRSLAGHLRGLFRYIIIDAPPMGGIADFDLIQAICDGVLLVLRPDATNRELCRNALRLIPDGKFLGVVLNCVPDWSLGQHVGSAYYGYGRETPKPKEAQPNHPQAASAKTTL
jgi:capsular exopolysaccharide synthesis family protein